MCVLIREWWRDSSIAQVYTGIAETKAPETKKSLFALNE
jgi:hypothetical protein